jgi:hypothetical protein
MKGRTLIAAALSGTAALALFGWAPTEGVAEANGCLTRSLEPARISAALAPSTRIRAIAAPQGWSKQTSAVKEPDETVGNSSSPVPFVAPGLDGLGASDVYFNKKWIGVDLASHHGRDSASTRGGS